MLAVAAAAKQAGFTTLYVPAEDAPEAALYRISQSFLFPLCQNCTST
jgi:hypothetical protein